MQSLLNPNMPVDNLVVVSNRGAYVLSEKNGQTTYTRAVSGLVSAVEPVLTSNYGTWVAWCGRLSNNAKSQGHRVAIPPEAPHYYLREVVLTESEYHAYYHGFANSSLWPLAHQLIDKCIFKKEFWHAYRRVNYKFAQATAESAREGDLFWIHDYHLTLAPQLLRRYYPRARIAFFWHIPFPPPDVFQVLPWGRQILHGLLGSDLVAFHTRSYMNNFLACVQHYFQATVNQEQGVIWLGKKKIMVRDLPVGVNWRRFEQLAADPQVKHRAGQIRQAIGADYLLLGIDRLDYTKGIPERIKALGILLEKHPQYRGKISLLQIAVPSRNGIAAYANLKEEVERAVGETNGLYDHGYGAIPVRYLHCSLNEKELVAHYLAADVLLVTPLRDGLNLVAKEFVASRTDGNCVLILSPFAGAADELKGALLANPYDPDYLAVLIKKALKMSTAEKQKRFKTLQHPVKSKDIRWWWQNNLKLIATPQYKPTAEKSILPAQAATRIANLY
jgi:trehalose 6-phosphate synthase